MVYKLAWECPGTLAPETKNPRKPALLGGFGRIEYGGEEGIRTLDTRSSLINPVYSGVTTFLKSYKCTTRMYQLKPRLPLEPKPYTVHINSIKVHPVSNVIPFQPRPTVKADGVDSTNSAKEFARSLPLAFRLEHCQPARKILGWSVEALAFRSGVSVKAIEDFERGARELLPVTLQALAFSLEREGLIFLPGIDPMTGDNLRGTTEDPKLRADYHLLE